MKSNKTTLCLIVHFKKIGNFVNTRIKFITLCNNSNFFWLNDWIFGWNLLINRKSLSTISKKNTCTLSLTKLQHFILVLSVFWCIQLNSVLEKAQKIFPGQQIITNHYSHHLLLLLIFFQRVILENDKNDKKTILFCRIQCAHSNSFWFSSLKTKLVLWRITSSMKDN